MRRNIAYCLGVAHSCAGPNQIRPNSTKLGLTSTKLGPIPTQLGLVSTDFGRGLGCLRPNLGRVQTNLDSTRPVQVSLDRKDSCATQPARNLIRTATATRQALLVCRTVCPPPIQEQLWREFNASLTELWQRFARVARIGSILAGVRQLWPNIGPTLVKLGSNLANFGWTCRPVSGNNSFLRQS